MASLFDWVILGAGGHAAVLIDCLGPPEDVAIAILEREPQRWGEMVLGVPIVGGDETIGELVERGATHFLVGVGSVGSTALKRRLWALGIKAGLEPLEVRHPSAIISPRASLGPGCQLLAGCVVGTSARLGADVLVNSGAMVEHDCQIGDHVHLATGARVTSTVRIGEGAHIGAGATVRQCLSIGAEAVVGAGAVVVDDVAEGAVVAGVPARPLRRGVER